MCCVSVTVCQSLTIRPILQNYRYLELLSVLCVCDGVSIADNQTYITEAWLKRGNEVFDGDISVFVLFS